MLYLTALARRLLNTSSSAGRRTGWLGGTKVKDRIETKQGKEYQQFRRRFQCGVEILERESVSTITVEDNEFKMTRQPRLIVNDAVNRSRKFIAKSKSQLGEINNVLQ